MTPRTRPPLTEERANRIERLHAMGDDDIDLSDIPETDLSRGVLRRNLEGARRLTGTVALEADVLKWLDAKDLELHRRVNAILREAMQREKAAATKAAA